MPQYQRLPGKAQRYIDTDTGESISRRQYDKQFGVLAREGFSSYERRDLAFESTAISYRFAKTVHVAHQLDPTRLGLLENQIRTVLSKQVEDYWGMYLYMRINGRNYGTVVVGYGDVKQLLKELKTLEDKYTLDEENEGKNRVSLVFIKSVR